MPWGDENAKFVEGRFVKARLHGVSGYGQYRGRGNLEVTPDSLVIQGKRVYPLGVRWGIALSIVVVMAFVTVGFVIPGLLPLYILVEYFILEYGGREVAFKGVRSIAFDQDRGLLALDVEGPANASPVVFKAPDAHIIFDALKDRVRN